MKKFDEYPILAVTSDDESYPFGMRKMSNNSVIYYKGDISLINATKNIAVIGARKISDKGNLLLENSGKAKVIKTQSDLEEFIDIVGEEKQFQQLTLL